MDLNTVATFFLYFGKEFVLVPLIVIGFLAYDRKMFGHALILLLFTMVYNAFLKGLFQVPLSEHIGKVGYAFPSGHMHAAVAFFGWLGIDNKNTAIRSLVVIILTGVAFGLIYKGYHNFYDILGAFVFGIITLLVYYPLAGTRICSARPYIMGYFMSALAAGIVWRLNQVGVVGNYVWMSFLVLISFTVSWTIFAKSTNSKPPIINSVIGFIFIIGAYYVSLKLKEYIAIEQNFQWVIVGLLIPFTASITSNLRVGS